MRRSPINSMYLLTPLLFVHAYNRTDSTEVCCNIKAVHDTCSCPLITRFNCFCPKRKRTLEQGCINSGRLIVMATTFCTVAPNIWGPSVWNLLHVTILAPRILRWLLDFWKTCKPLFFKSNKYYNTRIYSVRMNTHLEFRSDMAVSRKTHASM